MLITPPDGQVYYTSDVDSFVSDSAKIGGHYFYVDSDQNGFYETVYVLNDWYSLDPSNTPVYTVMSIGLNYDGIHDFVPYERLYDRTLVVSNFETLAQESVMFESDWVYNFRHLEGEELLQEFESKLEENNLKPKDQIFEIYKLVQTSEQNSEFSELFYEIRHKTYDTAWEQYKTQLIGDIAEQVFMSVTAALLSATVEAILTGTTFGFGWPAAKAAATFTYLSVYTLMTYFYIDIDLAKAEAEKRSQTFYSVSSDNREPTSLNEKNLLDRVLGDSMAAALIGHPGGYYTEVSGGESGNAYTGQLLVSPPNLLRMLYSFEGFLDLLWENFWNMGESDPDAYAALDFDDINLDYFLLTSELPSYNQNPYYTYENADGIFDLYNMYALNTLGYLETQVSQASNGQYDSIRATCIDGRPQYEFINSTLYQAVTPQSVLYRPIVLSQERYDQLQPAPGSLVIKARSKDYSNTIGIDAYAMSDVERKVYAAKVPLNDNGFEYPIRQISIDVVKYNIYTGFSYFVKGLIVNESDYSIDLGNLYFTKSIEELVSEKDSGFGDFLSYALAEELIESKIYFNVRIVFDVFVPDTTEETSSLALAQATSYAIMDYFNQYVFAETTANSISEIAYTETMTFWSTLISAPLVFFGSWAVKGTESMMGEASVELVKQGVLTQKQAIRQMLLSSFVGMALSPIKEVFQEIIEDGFTEALVENIVDIAGGTDALGFWVSSFVTSRRETTGALGQLALGDASLAFGDANLKTKLSLIASRIRGDANTIAEITQRVQQDVKQKQDAADLKREQMSSWQKLFSSNLFKGFLMFLPSVLYGSFSFVALKCLNDMIDSTESAVPKAYARYKSEVQAYRKGRLQDMVGKQDALINNMQEQMKKPAELESARPDINEKYKASQETQKENPPLAAFLSSLNPNPKGVLSGQELTRKFNEIQLSDWIGELTQDNRFEDMKPELEKIRKSTRKIDFRQRIDAITNAIKDTIKENFPNSLRFVDITGIELFDPNFILTGILPHSVNLFTQEIPVNPPNLVNQMYVPEVNFDFISSMTTEEVLQYLKNRVYFITGNIELNLFTLSGKKIPNNVLLADWLEVNGFSFDDKLVVIPSSMTNGDKQLFSKGTGLDQWIEGQGKASPYYPYFEDFLNELSVLMKESTGLKDYDEISKEILNDATLLHKELVRMRGGNNWRFKEKKLDKWFIELKSYISEKGTRAFQDQNIERLNSIFDKLYRVMGYASNHNNKLYRETKLLVQEIATILASDNIITSDSINELQDLLQGVDVRYYYNKIKEGKDPYKPEDVNILEILDESLHREGYSSNIIERVNKKIKPLVDSYTNKLNNWWGAESGILYGIKTKSPKIDLIKKIIHSSSIFQRLLAEVEGTMEQKSIFSQLLFGSNNYLNNRFITGRYGSHEQPKTSTLSRMRFMITKWNIELFNSIGLEATEFEIEGAKRVALEVFEDWIFSNPQHTFIDRLGDTKQWTPFIKEAFSKRGVQYTKDDLRPDFELSDTIITAVSHRLYRSIDTSRDSVVDFSLEKIRTGLEMGSKKFYRSLKNGKFFSQKTLERMYKKIAEWHVQELGDRESGLHYDRNDPNAQAKLYYYQKALKQIVSYANLRGITLFDGSSGIIQINSKQYQSNDILRNEYDRKYFIQQNYKQFHMLFQLAKYLGFDPLTFTSLDDKDMASQGGYALHHFLAEMMRQMSSNVADIVCTSSDLHNTYEKYKLTREGEAFIRGLMKTIQDLIFLKDSSGSYISRIKPAHVLNKLIDNLGVEKGNEAYQRWTSSPNKFMENLDKFNDRRPFALSKDPNKYRIFLENVFTETWKNRNQDAIKYYHFIRKSWASNVAILFSYNADIDIMNSVYRIGIPLA